MKQLASCASAFEGLRDHFNEKRIGTYFLRRAFVEDHGFHVENDEVKMQEIDQLLLVFKRAAYIKMTAPGVYQTVKRIPTYLGESKVRRIARNRRDLRDGTATKVVKVKRVVPDFMRPLLPSLELALVLGSTKPVARTQVVKAVWAYIKKNNLQDSKNKRNINADALLRPVFGKDMVNLFEMSKHLTPVKV